MIHTAKGVPIRDGDFFSRFFLRCPAFPHFPRKSNAFKKECAFPAIRGKATFLKIKEAAFYFLSSGKSRLLGKGNQNIDTAIFCPAFGGFIAGNGHLIPHANYLNLIGIQIDVGI